jgi:hypothetical protein
MHHASGDVGSRLPAAPDGEHAIRVLESCQALQAGQYPAMGGRQIARHNAAGDATIRYG